MPIKFAKLGAKGLVNGILSELHHGQQKITSKTTNCLVSIYYRIRHISMDLPSNQRSLIYNSTFTDTFNADTVKRAICRVSQSPKIKTKHKKQMAFASN